MAFSIVILNYNTYLMTLKLLDNLKDLQEKCDFRIIVVDNNSSNESVRFLREKQKSFNFELIVNDRNLGYAAGNNVGLRRASEYGSKYVLITNNDIEVPNSNVFEDLFNLLENDETIAAVSPKIIFKDGRKDPPLYLHKPSFYDLTFGMRKNKKERYSFDENKNSQIYAPRGSFMMLRVSALNKIGFLDESTFLYYEEPILAERLSKEGLQCWHCGDSFVIHNHGKTINSVLKKKQNFSYLSNSLKIYLQKYLGFTSFAIFICIIFRKIAFMRRR